MKHLLYLIISLPLLWLSACNVHEWPKMPEKVSLHVRLNYETNMTVWEHSYDNSGVKEEGLGETYDNRQKKGKIRYIVRTYPTSDKQRTLREYTQEFIFTKDMAEGYDHEVTLDLLPGDYSIMVWSDLIVDNEHPGYYNADNFAQIFLQGEHVGNNDYRDAFRGKSNLSLYPDIINQVQDTISITMKRPLAKFEIVANDLLEFIETNSDDINQYKAKVQYIGFMPNTYSMFTDKPVDSSTRVGFEATLKKKSDSEASMAFDYVFMGEIESAVTIKIGIYDNKGKQLSLTESIKIPLKSDYHTILKGKFLMQNASGGINIYPGFDGNYNLIIP